MLRQPPRLGQSRFELEMFTRQKRPAEIACDPEGIARLGAGPERGLAPEHVTEHRHGQEHAAGIRCGLAADDGHVVLPRESGHSRVDPFDGIGIELLRQGEGDERGGGRAGHGGDVAQASTQGLVPDLFRGRIGLEMNSLDDGVGLEQEQAVRQAEIQHGAVVSGPDHDRFIGRQRVREAGDQFKLVHGLADTR